MTDEENKINSFKRYIQSQENKLDEYYILDDSEDSFYKDEIEQLELSILLLKKVLELIENQQIALEQKDKEIQELKESDKRSSEQILMMSQRHFNDSQKNKKLKADLYECNNIISDYIDTVKEKDKIIGLMAKKINEAFFGSGDFEEWFENKICKVLKSEDYTCLEKDIKQYFQKKAREEND